MNIQIIRTDGTEETFDGKFNEIAPAIGAEVLDTVNLRDGRVMMVDDNGYETRAVTTEFSDRVEIESVPIKAKKPVNEKATEMYHAICVPGTTHKIVGDVAIVIDKEDWIEW